MQTQSTNLYVISKICSKY